MAFEANIASTVTSVIRRLRRVGTGRRNQTTSVEQRLLPRRRAAVFVAAGVALAMFATACTAGSAGGGNDGGGTQAGSGEYLNFSPCCTWNSTWSFNPYNTNGLINLQPDFLSLRLAIQKTPSLTEYEPQLADRWSVEGDKMTVHLRPGTKWHDGTPVTSKDLYDTALLNGLNGAAFWSDITGLSAPTEDTVVFTLREGQPEALAYNDILNNIFVYPSSVYGQFVTSQVEKDVPAYFRQAQKDPGKALKMPEYTRMNEVFKKLAAHKVDKFIGNGPFKLDSITTSQAKMTKWDDFYAADKIKVAGINYGNGSNETIYPQLFSGTADLSEVYLPPPILQRWNNTPDANIAIPSSFGFVLSFNNHRYPLNKTKVRQALAHVIPRQTITEAAYGNEKGAGGSWKEVSTGLTPPIEELYLDPQQVGSLNPYPVDADKATELLEAADFKKTDGQWIMPDGKPFTLTFTADSSTSDVVTTFTSAAKALTEFGIKSDVNGTSGAQRLADQRNGDFDAGINFVGANNPLTQYQQIMGSTNNYPDLGNYAGKRGIGIGPKADIPGLGEVTVPSTMDAQARNVAPDQEMKDLSWNWAQYVNEQVPYIYYATKEYQFSYSTKRFENWPPVDDQNSSPLWDIIGATPSAGLLLAMEQGYIVGKG